MTNSKFFHKKKKNVGLLYEIVIQEITKNILGGSDDKFKNLYSILRKNFHKDSEFWNRSAPTCHL